MTRNEFNRGYDFLPSVDCDGNARAPYYEVVVVSCSYGFCETDILGEYSASCIALPIPVLRKYALMSTELRLVVAGLG